MKTVETRLRRFLPYHGEHELIVPCSHNGDSVGIPRDELCERPRIASVDTTSTGGTYGNAYYTKGVGADAGSTPARESPLVPRTVLHIIASEGDRGRPSVPQVQYHVSTTVIE